MSGRNVEELVKSLEPQFTTLSDKGTRDRPVKRRAIETIATQVKSWIQTSTSNTELLERLHESLFACSESDIENVREQTVNLLNRLVNDCEKGKIEAKVIENILNQTVKRIQQEETEEVRVTWMETITALLGKLEELKITVAEGELFMKLMQISGDDPFPDVQKQCAKLLVLYSQTQSKSVDYACDRMVRLLTPLLVHKHTAVRVQGIKAMEAVLLASPKGLHLLFEFDEKSGRQPLVPGLIYDPSAFVRDNLFIALSNLLCHWSPRYRYQYGGQVLPIILSGKFDDLPSVQETCKSSLAKVSSSCVQDLLDAEIIEKIPDDKQEAELLGLKHFVHICYNESLLYILGQVTNFIQVRQDMSLESLELFLELSAPDDLVGSIKKLVHYLFIAYATTNNKKILQCLDIITTKLPSADIYAEALLPRLDYKYLQNEKNGFEGTVTVPVVLSFLEQLVNCASLSQVSQQKIINILQKPYLNEYISKDSLENYRHSITCKLGK